MRVIFLGLLLLGSVNLDASCFAPKSDTELERVSVAFVYDGDTLTLKDGRKIRLLNINTPELGRDGRPDDAFAVAASDAAKQWLGARSAVFLQFDLERKDRYGRWLAHVLDEQQNSLGEHLLARGLASPLAVPPNLELADCYFSVAADAKRHQLGLWQGSSIVNVNRISKAGFQTVQGVVSKLSKSRSGDYWIELQGQLAIQIRTQDVKYFPDIANHYAVGTQLLVSGWLQQTKPDDVKRKGYAPWRVQVRTAHAVSVNR